VSGSAWVSGDAQVYGDARVYGSAWVYDNAQVYGSARVSGSARVYGDAQVYGDARVYGDAQVYGDARVYSSSRVYGGAWEKSPLQIQGSRDFCNMCASDVLCVAGQCLAIELWQVDGQAYLAASGYSDDEIVEYMDYIALAKRRMPVTDKPAEVGIYVTVPRQRHIRLGESGT
jgi:hypothetical protein